MDCGIPFCHQGCPLGNLIPEWNDLVYRGRFASAIERLHATNNFPEFTGRLCPAPCESACVVAIADDPVAIERTEYEIAERAWSQGLIQPIRHENRSGKTVAIVGSGPAGLAAAQQLCRAGHDVTVFERSDAIGGLLRFGIPEFKMEKSILDRRLAQLVAEGVRFETGVSVGAQHDVSLESLRRDYSAVVLAIGSTRPRDLDIPGREARGIYPAMDFLSPANREAVGGPSTGISAAGKRVVILGGGDTGADCLGTAHRQGALSVIQMELLPQPPSSRPDSAPWPTMPLLYKVTSAHEEGGERRYALRTREFRSGDAGQVIALIADELDYSNDGDARVVGEATFDVDLVLIAAGFIGPEIAFMEGVPLTSRGTLSVDTAWMCMPASGEMAPVFAAGDSVRGQSLIVWAIAEGRSAASAVHAHLSPEDDRLPSPVTPYSVSWA
jgi:glutamate synthase (NADPH/NADH) small chain